MPLRLKAVRTGVYKGAMAFAFCRFTLEDSAELDPTWMEALEEPVPVIPPPRDPLDDLEAAVARMPMAEAERAALRPRRGSRGGEHLQVGARNVEPGHAGAHLRYRHRYQCDKNDASPLRWRPS